MHRGPQRGHAHAEVAVAANCDRQAARTLERERGADGDARSASDAAASLGADVVERMPERPGGPVPGERQMRERDVTLADRGSERAGEIIDPDRCVGRLVGFGFCRDGCRLARLAAAQRSKELRHRRIGCRGQHEIDWRQHFVIHAPAVVHVEVGADTDDLRLRCLAAEGVAQRAAEVDPVERKDHVRRFDRRDRLGHQCVRSGGARVQRMIGRKTAGDLEVADHLGIERLCERDARVPCIETA